MGIPTKDQIFTAPILLSMEISSVDATAIPATSISRSLDGAVVALKAPQSYVKPLADFLQNPYGSRCDSPLSHKPSPSDDINIVLPFHEWFSMLTSAGFGPGTSQLALVSLAVALMREKARRNIPLDAETLDTVLSLVCNAITTSQFTDLHFTVSRSAQGFLAIPLCSLIVDGRIDELWRLHTWLPDNRRGVNEKVSIHSHQPFGQSWILLGSGTDCSYAVNTPNDTDEATTHAIYQCCFVGLDGKESGPGYQTHQMKSIIRNTNRHVRVREIERKLHTRDISYSVPAGHYHRSVVPGRRLHATFFVFDAQRGYDDAAAVLGPKDEFEYDQPRDPAGITAETLAQIVTATRRLEQSRQVRLESEVEDPLALAYCRYFQGMAHLQAGRREEALNLFNAVDGGCTVVQAFTTEPSMLHREYLQMLAHAGATVEVN